MSQIKPTQEQLDIIDAFKQTRVLKVNAVAGAGKEQPVSCIIKTPEGDKRLGDIQIGDTILGSSGKPIKVTGVFPQGVKDVYEVVFRDGSKTRCGIEHNWSVHTTSMRDKNKYTTMTLAEIIDFGLYNSGGAMKVKVPLVKPVQYSEKSLKLHPYILGAFLGNGSFTGSCIAISVHADDTEVISKISSLFRQSGIELKTTLRNTSKNGLQTTLIDANSDYNRITKMFRDLGVSSKSKFIPEEYMLGSVEQRTELLKGLMDTDGCSSRNRISFSNTNLKLILQVKELVQSLGGTAILRKPDYRKTTSICYDLNVKLHFAPFSLNRKASNWKYSEKNPPSRYIKEINKLDYKEEQVCISVDAEDKLYLTDEFIVTHNTSTLLLLAEANKQPSLLLAFNKAIAEEAKQRFPSHVSCRTMNSIAYETFGKRLQHKLNTNKNNKVNTMRSLRNIVDWFGLKDYTDAVPAINARTIASMARDVVERFCYSDRTSISEQDLYYKEFKELKKLHEFDESKLSLVVLNLAKMIWKERINPVSKACCTHDTYVKLWSLSNPVLNYNILYVDESQDINPCVLTVLEKQQCKILYVGDEHQSIYAFRGATNAMKHIVCPTMHLSRSWRYGEAVAAVAEFVLSKYDVEVNGNPEICSYLENVTDLPNYTMIFRTNAALFEEAEKLIEAGKQVKVEINIEDFVRQIKSAVSLRRGEKPFHDNIARFGSWYEMIEFSKESVEIQRLANMASRPDVQELINRLEQVNTSSKPDIILTTAHKSKGLEYDNVVIADDFRFGKENVLDMPEQEINLLYVACTRAKKNLQLPTAMGFDF